jgi:flagellin
MAYSFQTNVTSVLAQENLRVNSLFQSQTIQRLTSGFRINSSGDDAAGLAVANKYRSDIASLQQGVRNANDGISVLQIVDGGLNNISKTVDRLSTLATQSASAIFSGNRDTLNQEFQSLLGEITRQANNIGLANGGKYNTVNTIFIGGGNTAANGQVSIDLSGSTNQVDAAGLGLGTASIAAGGTLLTGNTVRLDAPGATFLSAVAQVFTFNLYSPTAGATTVTASVGGAGALTSTQVLASLNSTLNAYGINASIASNGQLEFGGGTPFTVSAATSLDAAPIATASTATNAGVYTSNAAATYTGVNQTLTLQNGQGTKTVTLLLADTIDTAISKINAQTSSIGLYAVKNAAGTGVSFQSSSNFTASQSVVSGVYTAAGSQTVTAPASTGSVTGNAVAALAVITQAITLLGNVQGRVGSGQNLLQYSIQLAQSQISSFSAAQSSIRDADIAAEASNLTKAQTLQQASLAALAQANSAPQAVLALLK